MMESIGCTADEADGVTSARSDEFDVFVRRVEARLRAALMATFGPVDGRVAAVDALSWAWEHWSQVRDMENPVGYLYRVGRTQVRRSQGRPIPVLATGVHLDEAVVSPELVAALGELSAQQRTVVMLVHAFGWTHRDVADLLDLTPSTVQTHVERGVARLRDRLGQLQEHDDVN